MDTKTILTSRERSRAMSPILPKEPIESTTSLLRRSVESSDLSVLTNDQIKYLRRAMRDLATILGSPRLLSAEEREMLGPLEAHLRMFAHSTLDAADR